MKQLLLLKHVLIQRLRRKGVFVATDGRSLSKLTLEEIQQEYERAEGKRDELVKSNA
ncbi:Fur-regulated basic protein FbpA [Anoxybacillus ayderensis]|uniref:Fur-regulated basic protein FbpA n=1 Tax=Anoxybacillus ayderensis TaxID=265546 RepID=UPI001CB9A6E6|nr:Fur-regulated basic protein FbpA [Anoxybacillus ayderensis]